MRSKKSSTKFWLMVCACLLAANFFVMMGIWTTRGNLNQIFSTFSFFNQGYNSKFDKFTAIDALLHREYADQGLLSGARDEMIERALQAYVA